MVHIKRIELSHFKSFGGTTSIPFLPGFTVVSGPNGSGKSNILDALLFCLNLASSKGMRAERLPDLVNHDRQGTSNSSSETTVSVTFELNDCQELTEDEPKQWTVTRRLRVSKNGSYASTFYLNGTVCSANELQEQLSRLRIYSEGYNVVLQGDVTRIITMNGKERREIIDELAGVAQFDRKIEQAKQTLTAVKEREERFEFIQQELSTSCDRLAGDRIKAEKYQKLKVKIQAGEQEEIILSWQLLCVQKEKIIAEINGLHGEIKGIEEELEQLNIVIEREKNNVASLNQQVKGLGEEEQLEAASQLATQKVQRHQLEQRQQELVNLLEQKIIVFAQTEEKISQYEKDIQAIAKEEDQLTTITIPELQEQCNLVREILNQTKAKATDIANASEAWVEEQTTLTRQVTNLQKILNPLRTEEAQLKERQHQLAKKIAEQNLILTTTAPEITAKQIDRNYLNQHQVMGEIQTLTQQLSNAEQELIILQDTQKRLLKEQRDKQRELDKLEATKQAQQEAQGTYSTQVILNANLAGVLGLVAQLGQVETQYQLALEIAAGGRLANIVVENDAVAAKAIEFLKQRKAGRATFLPLNKIQSGRILELNNLRYATGFIDLAVNLIDCEQRYRHIFSYVFGNTIIFTSLNEARSYLGQYRIVTLDGELLETSGAMTGGSQISKSTLHFGLFKASELEEIETVKRRLSDLEKILIYNEEAIAEKTLQVKELSEKLTEKRQVNREEQLRIEQLEKELKRLETETKQLNERLQENQQEQEKVQQNLENLSLELPEREIELQNYQQRLNELESDRTHGEWQEIQTTINQQEQELQEREKALRITEEKLKQISDRQINLAEKKRESLQTLTENERQQQELKQQQILTETQLKEIAIKIATTEAFCQQISEQLKTIKQERDRAENELKKIQEQQQKQTWQLEKKQSDCQEKINELERIQQQILIKAAENNLTEVPLENNHNLLELNEQLEKLQKELRQEKKRLEAMEPVNMLALEEYENTQTRLQELSEKLTTLAAERTELLSRLEQFTTLRLRAFNEAFTAVNENFQSIFATLSEGDGYLQLDDAENPFNGGLNILAHPKGKPVQRLSSMSGGEKSLTALSFIFALQRYRPSPFYAFDEVDMFLDGANVERLAKMIEKQAEQAQFIVVSLRRPMIESSERTIGVTQARGAYTQVLGIKTANKM